MLNNLNYPFKQHSWYIVNNIGVIGYAFYNNEVLEKNNLVSFFSDITSEDEFETALAQLDGSFAVWIQHKHFTAAAVDIIRSIPILYTFLDGKLVPFKSDIKSYEKNNLGIRQLKNAWCVLDNETLLEDVFQLQAGQYIFSHQNKKVKPKYYYKHFAEKKNTLTTIEDAKQVLDNTFKKFIPFLQNKQVVIPLSGGYDSRLMLTKMVEHKHQNIIAYTYGNFNSHEVKIAKKVCETLNVEWHFVEYTEEVFKSFFSNSWSAYSNKNHFYSGLPHEQDFFALKVLKERGILQSGFVALPGFCGDLLGGSITAKRPNAFSKFELSKFIIKNNLQGFESKLDLSFINTINNEKNFYDAYQHWFVCNKVSKFIVNSIRVYEHFGGTWYLPLWTKTLIDFWYQVPYKKRKQQQFYNQLLFDKYFTPLKIDFKKPGFDDNYPNRLKEKIKDVMPDKWVKSIQKKKQIYPSNDVNNLSILNVLIQDKLNETLDTSEINNTHALFFLKNLNMQ